MLSANPYAPLISMASSLITSYLRKAPWFGVVGADSVGKVHALNAGVAALLTAGCMYFTGQLDQDMVSATLETLMNSFFAFSGATAIYEVGKSVDKVK